MRRVAALFILVSICVASAFAQNEDALKELRLGIVPFSSPANLFKNHKPLKDFLSAKLGIAVKLYTSKNHETFLEDGLDNRFDILLTPAHFAPFFGEAGFVPLVKYTNSLDLVFVVSKESSISSLDDIAGKTIGLPDFPSLYYIVGYELLGRHAKDSNYTYRVVPQASHVSGAHAVALGKIDAIITGTPPFNAIEKEVREKLKPIAISDMKLPSIITMADSKLGGEMIKNLKKALDEFGVSKEGAEFFKSLGYGGYIDATAADMKSYLNYKPIVEKLIEERKKI